MKNLTLFFTVASLLTVVTVKASVSETVCANPNPLHGKIMAICGNQIVAYVGNEKVQILGLKTVTSRFELVSCQDGGDRKDLYMKTHSEGFNFSYKEPNSTENYEIIQAWGTFKLTGVDENGASVNLACVSYKDTRKDIEYIY